MTHLPSVVPGQQQQLTQVSPVSLISQRSSLLAPNQGFPKLGPDANKLATAPRVERKLGNPRARQSLQQEILHQLSKAQSPGEGSLMG